MVQGFAAVLQADTPDSFEESLHLHGIQFNWSISITYFMVTLLLIPSNLLMKTVSGKRYFPCIMISFGTIVCSIAAVKGPRGLLAARFFLGRYSLFVLWTLADSSCLLDIGIPESGVVCTALKTSRPLANRLFIGSCLSDVLQLLV